MHHIHISVPAWFVEACFKCGFLEVHSINQNALQTHLKGVSMDGYSVTIRWISLCPVHDANYLQHNKSAKEEGTISRSTINLEKGENSCLWVWWTRTSTSICTSHSVLLLQTDRQTNISPYEWIPGNVTHFSFHVLYPSSFLRNEFCHRRIWIITSCDHRNEERTKEDLVKCNPKHYFG